MDIINLKDQQPDFNNVVVEPIQNLLLNKGESWNVLCDGRQSIGKSGSMLTLCDAVQPGFDPYTQIVFTVKQYVELLRSNTLKVGSAFLFDECGDDLGSRSGMNPEQRRLMAMKQADRILGLLGCFTLPKGSMADKQLRQLVHSQMEGITKNEKLGQTAFKYKVNEWKFNKQGEPIYRFPSVMVNGEIKKVRYVWISKPPVKLWHVYSKLKIDNLNRLLDGILSRKDLKDKNDPLVLKDELDSIVEKVMNNPEPFKNRLGRIDWRLIRHEYSIPTEKAREVMVLIGKRQKNVSSPLHNIIY